jgi:hypothetical protein
MFAIILAAHDDTALRAPLIAGRWMQLPWASSKVESIDRMTAPPMSAGRRWSLNLARCCDQIVSLLHPSPRWQRISAMGRFLPVRQGWKADGCGAIFWYVDQGCAVAACRRVVASGGGATGCRVSDRFHIGATTWW